MKGTEHFKQAIKAYLDERAKTDELFAVSYAKENKNLDDCVTFILNHALAICKKGGAGKVHNHPLIGHKSVLNCKIVQNRV